MNIPNDQYWIWGLIDQNNENVISDMRREVFREVLSPDFPIHVTLSGPIELDYISIKSILKNFLDNRNNIFVPLKNLGIGWDNTKFRFLYIKVGHNKLINLKKSIDNIFKKNEANFMPHISIAYSDVFDIDRSKYKNKLKDLVIKDLFIERICIASVNEKENRWNIVKTFDL